MLLVCVCGPSFNKKNRWPLIKTAELEELNRRESGAVPASGTGLASPSVLNLIRHTTQDITIGAKDLMAHCCKRRAAKT